MLRQRTGPSVLEPQQPADEPELLPAELAGPTAATALERGSAVRLRLVRQAEQSLVQLQGMLSNFARLLADQGEMLQHIDHNLDKTVLYVDDTHTLLQRQLAIVRRNRGLIIKLLCFTAFVVVLFFVFRR